MESWRRVFRDGFAPLLSEAALAAVQQALLMDDTRLIQGATTVPPPVQCALAWPVEAACLIGYACWQGEGLSTVAEVEESFAQACFAADAALAEPAACRYFLNFVDGVPRHEMRSALLPEIQREIKRRRSAV